MAGLFRLDCYSMVLFLHVGELLEQIQKFVVTKLCHDYTVDNLNLFEQHNQSYPQNKKLHIVVS